MKKYILLALSLCFITSEANAQFLPPKGLNQQSIINAPNTSLDGKTMLNMAQRFDLINSTANNAQLSANNAQNSANDANTAATNNAAAIKVVQSAASDAQTSADNAQNTATVAQTTANNAIPKTEKGIASGVAALDSNKMLSNNLTSLTTIDGGVSSTNIVDPGEYNISDLPVVLSSTTNPNGNSVSASPTYYYVTKVTVDTPSSNCPVGTTFNIPYSNMSVQLSDGNGSTSGYTISITKQSNHITDADLPYLPKDNTYVSYPSYQPGQYGCANSSGPTFHVYYGIGGLNILDSGNNYSTAPTITGQVGTGLTSTNITTTINPILNLNTQWVKKKDLNVAGGPATLDNKNNLTSDVNNKNINTQIINVGSVGGILQQNTSMGSVYQLPGNTIWYGNNYNLGYYIQNGGNTYLSSNWVDQPETLHIGGATSNSSGYVNIHCDPIGGSNSGTCLQSMIGSTNVQGLAAGIGPGSSGMANYDNFDVANIVLQNAASTPRFVTTSNLASNVRQPLSDGLDHTPTFTATGATFANPLPAEQSQWLIDHVGGAPRTTGIRILTNEIGCTTCDIAYYAGIIQSVQTNTDNLVTGITIDQWQVFSSGNSNSGQIPGTSIATGMGSYPVIGIKTTDSSGNVTYGPIPSGTTTLTFNAQIPFVTGQNYQFVNGTGGLASDQKIASWSYASSANSFGIIETTVTLASPTTSAINDATNMSIGVSPTLDTKWTDFKYPAIMFGVYTKVFNNYTLCGVGGPHPEMYDSNGKITTGDINSPDGSLDDQLRVCETAEYDLQNWDPNAGEATIHGLTVAFTQESGAGLPNSSSYDFMAAGANITSYAQTGEYYTIPFSGSMFDVSGYGGVTYNAGDIKNVVQFGQSERAGYESDGGWLRNNINTGIWNQRNVLAGTGGEDAHGSYVDITTHIGRQIAPYDANQKDSTFHDALWNQTVDEQIELNPASNHNGINLCAGTQDDTTCAVQVSTAAVAERFVAPRKTTSTDYTLTEADAGHDINVDSASDVYVLLPSTLTIGDHFYVTSGSQKGIIHIVGLSSTGLNWTSTDGLTLNGGVTNSVDATGHNNSPMFSNNGEIFAKYEIILRNKAYGETYYEIHRLEH